MIGGKVIEVCNVPGRPDVLFVNVADRPYKKLETCGVLVENNETSRKIEIGDSLWWQCGICYWTRQDKKGHSGKSGVDYDIAIPKRSGSGVTFESVSNNKTS
jgi:hypothetical protein